MLTYVLSGLMMRMAPQWMRMRFELLEKWVTGIRVLDDSDDRDMESMEPGPEDNPPESTQTSPPETHSADETDPVRIDDRASGID